MSAINIAVLNNNSHIAGKIEEPTPFWTEESVVENEDSGQSSIEIDSDDSDSQCEMNEMCRINQQIWEDNEIVEDLHALPGVDDLFENISKDNINTKDNLSSALLIASWLAKDKLIKRCLDEGVDPNVMDIKGRTPLHLASVSGGPECLKMLIEHGADVRKWDRLFKVTPLHCAASKGHICCVKILIKHGADVNANLSQKSPLHYAVQSEAIECIKELLEAGALPYTSQVFSETPLHVAAAMGSPEILKLLLSYGASVSVQCGAERQTALHLAAADGELKCVEILLDSGADIESKNRKHQTPLHLATLYQSTEILELLLKRGASPNARDIDGRTPLHTAIVKFSRSCDIPKTLLNAGADVNQPDIYGYTPLHLAALNEFSQCVMLLLSFGANMTARTNGGISALTFITRRTPDIIPKFRAKLDTSIRLNDHEIGDVDCELKLNFKVLVPSVANGETDLLLNFIEVGHKEILMHPLCETFLFLKWRKIRKFFLFSLFYHALFVFLFTAYILGVYLKGCVIEKVNNSTTNDSNKDIPCEIPTSLTIVAYFLIILNCMLMGKEIFQITHSWLIYIKEWENWLQWLIIISVFCCVSPHSNDLKSDLSEWQHHVAAISIFLTWLELMMIVGRFPIFGLYIQMFKTVSVNFSKFLMAYMWLIMAFGLSFGVLCSNYKAFKNPAYALLKTIIMMSGELEYEDVFFDEDAPIIHPYTAHLMLLLFVVLVTIILANLMVGLAVSDIQGLQRSAGLDRLVRQAELVAHLESMLFSKLLYCVPRRLLACLHKQALLMRSDYDWALYIKPNDPREQKIPKEIIKSIYKLVVGRKDKQKRKRRSNKSRCGDKELISRVNSNTSSISREKM
nr:transient receptor potential channel pyrexia-like [Onthophagus taurus]